MAKKKLGMGTIEINKKFGSREEAFKYAKRLKEHIRYICEKKAYKGWYAQAMIIVSSIRGSSSYLEYEQNGKSGRPKKIKRYSKYQLKYYNGNLTTDWHLHILLLSKPSYAFRNDLKEYIDKNWNDIPNIYEKEKFDISKLEVNKSYKKVCNINIAEYFINQSDDILFCDYNYSKEERLEYNLKQYYREFLKSNSAKNKLIKEQRASFKVLKPMSEEMYLNKLEKAEKKFKDIENYFYKITEDNDKKEADNFMKKIQLSKISEVYNKVQENSNRIIYSECPF